MSLSSYCANCSALLNRDEMMGKMLRVTYNNAHNYIDKAWHESNFHDYCDKCNDDYKRKNSGIKTPEIQEADSK